MCFLFIFSGELYIRTMRKKLRKIIFGIDTPAGRRYDIILLYIILLSIAVVMLDSVDSIREKYGTVLTIFEWGVTAFFTFDYIARIYCAENRKKYIFSWFGIIDLLSTIPSYVGLFLRGTKPFSILRSLRLLRVFRILDLSSYMIGSQVLLKGLKESKNKIIVFLFAVLTIVMIIGSIMYVVENDNQQFISIPQSVYWAIVTITTVGYGDISPHTAVGQLIASALMLIGYAIIAVPTGIVTSSMINQKNKTLFDQNECPKCKTLNHLKQSNYCHKCGEELNG